MPTTRAAGRAATANALSSSSLARSSLARGNLSPVELLRRITRATVQLEGLNNPPDTANCTSLINEFGDISATAVNYLIQEHADARAVMSELQNTEKHNPRIPLRRKRQRRDPATPTRRTKAVRIREAREDRRRAVCPQEISGCMGSCETFDWSTAAEICGLDRSVWDLDDIVSRLTSCSPDWGLIWLDMTGEKHGHATCDVALILLQHMPLELRENATTIILNEKFTDPRPWEIEDACELGLYLVNMMPSLQIVSLPKDAQGSRNGQLPSLHHVVFDAFRHRKLAQVRLVSKSFSSRHGLHVYKDPQISWVYTVQMLRLVLLWKRIMEQHSCCAWTSISLKPSSDAWLLESLCAATVQARWHNKGFDIQPTSRLPGETGSVAVIDRKPNYFTKQHYLEQCEAAMIWWSSRCAHCISAGKFGLAVQHRTKTCAMSSTIGESPPPLAFRRGCPKCALPLVLCNAHNNGRCRFGTLVYDTFSALYSGQYMFLKAHADGSAANSGYSLAEYLTAPRSGSHDSVSQIFDLLLIWTRAIQDRLIE